MKKALIGGFLSLLGTIWALVIVSFTANHPAQAWANPPGRFLTTVFETGMLIPAVIAAVLLLGGIAIMGIEYFRKDR